MLTFESLNLSPNIVKSVYEQGYETPTPVQTEAIPIVLSGCDLLASAQTGTGKTAAFTLPILHRLSTNTPSESIEVKGSKNQTAKKIIRALVLTPTRELATQIEASVRNYGQYLTLRSAVVFGGVGQIPQIHQLKHGIDILVATPGRLLDLQSQGYIDLSQIEILVLDEADRMLDMGFINDIKRILTMLPSQKQTLLFSATFNHAVRELALSLLKNPKNVQVTPENTTVQSIVQRIHPVGRQYKKELLTHIIEKHQWSQVLVFVRTKFIANQVSDYLNSQNIKAKALHGNKSQVARTQALSHFKQGNIRVLVATDIAARGLDIEHLPHVVNYDIPNISEDYVHRIGRTGRAGAGGEAISLVSIDEEGFMAAIEAFIDKAIQRQPIAEFSAPIHEKAEPITMGRQVLWGGLGKPPPRSVMAAASKASYHKMIQQQRSSKASIRHHPAKNKSQKNQSQNQGQKGVTHHSPLPFANELSHARQQKPKSYGKPNRSGQYSNGNSDTVRPSSTSNQQPDHTRTSIDHWIEKPGFRQNRYSSKTDKSPKDHPNRINRSHSRTPPHNSTRSFRAKS